MRGKTRYICFDTNIYIFCALSTKEDGWNPGFLRRLFRDMDSCGVMLLVPDVVELELCKVLNREVGKMECELAKLRKQVNDNELLGSKLKHEIAGAIKESQKELKNEAQTICREIIDRMHDKEKSVIVHFSSGDILNEAIRLSLRGAKPSKSDQGYGLLQGDCLIAASIRHFVKSHPDSDIVFCSDNTRDFASKSEDGLRWKDDLAEYLGDVRYCAEPKELYDLILDSGGDDEEIAEYSDEFKRISSASNRVDLAESLIGAVNVNMNGDWAKGIAAATAAAMPESAVSALGSVGGGVGLPSLSLPSACQIEASRAAAGLFHAVTPNLPSPVIDLAAVSKLAGSAIESDAFRLAQEAIASDAARALANAVRDGMLDDDMSGDSGELETRSPDTETEPERDGDESGGNDAAQTNGDGGGERDST